MPLFVVALNRVILRQPHIENARAEFARAFFN